MVFDTQAGAPLGDPAFAAVTERLARVQDDIRATCEQVGRDSESVTIIAVTKFHPPELVRHLHSLGLRDFGESRHPESRDKTQATRDLEGLRWHFIGQLQTNKARHVVAYANCIHSVDRIALVDALVSALAQRPVDAPLELFVQLSLREDAGRGGVADRDLEQLVEAIAQHDSLRLRGIMAVAPLGEEPDVAFARARAASLRVQALMPGASDLSIGMSGDYRSALSQGATHLRIGAAITGPRPVRA